MCDAGTCTTAVGEPACPDGTAGLTGFMGSVADGGGTAWLRSQAPVVPGEVFDLELHIWDTSDHVLDSTVLLDNFQWLQEPTPVLTER